MCGFVGFIDSRCADTEGLETVTRMSSVLAHRGPDDSGSWSDSPAGLYLGFRRLAILDLSAEGRQPMQSASGRYCIVFNGEIYNFQDLRDELLSLGVVFRGGSDTEVLLAYVEHFGIDKTLSSLTGMYAFALWDRSERELCLARDRMGEKPLYYGKVNGVLFFGSELKSFAPHPSWQPEIDRDALTLFLRLKYIPAPYSIYRNVKKLLPGSSIRLKFSDRFEIADPRRYWSAKSVAEKGIGNRFTGGEREAIDQLDQLLKAAIGRQMIADVPLGAFLSGGIDSSTVVAIMQSLSSRPVKTFSIGFEEAAFDEAVYSRKVASHLGTDHTELYLSPQQVLDVMPLMAGIWDEPFSDSSQVPTYLVAKLAREQVTVSLSGDGGDELFSGYSRYRKAERLMARLARLPRQFHSPLSSLLFPTARVAEQFDRRMSFRLKLAAQLFAAGSREDFYYTLISDWRNPSEVVRFGKEPKIINHSVKLAEGSYREWMQLFDQSYYLPDDIMVKVDRASMAVSLESRAPLLDHSLVEFAWSLPENFKVRDNQSKWILKQLLKRYLPANLFERPKQGFAMPLGTWLRGPLRPWADSLLAASAIEQSGFFEPRVVEQAWSQHLAGVRDLSSELWSILSFESWLLQTKR